MDFEHLEDETTSPVSLAEWHCDEVLWKAFRKSEMQLYLSSLRASNHLAIISTAVVTLVLFAIALTSILGYRRWQSNIGPAAFILVIGSVFIFAGVFTGFRRRKREKCLAKPTGDVVVAMEGFAYNKFQVNWGFGNSIGVRFQHCERRTVNGDLGYSFQILAFDTDAMVYTGRGTIHEKWTWNVPVPMDKIAVADMVCDRLNTRRGSDTES